MVDFCEGAVELGEGLEADEEGDFGDAGGGSEEFFAGPVDAGTGDVVGEGEPGDVFEDAAEVGFGEAGDVGDGGEGEGFVEVGVDVAAGLEDGFGFFAFIAEGEFFGVGGELLGEGFEEGDHGGVALGVDGLGLEVGVVEFLEFVGGEG